MLTPLLLATALALGQVPAPAPTGALTLSNVRSTYGELGGPRPLTPLLPGDVMFLGFDIDYELNSNVGRPSQTACPFAAVRNSRPPVYHQPLNHLLFAKPYRRSARNR